MDQIERARELFQSGYNCCQAVVGAYAEALGMDFDEAMRRQGMYRPQEQASREAFENHKCRLD